ncbi:MAG: hypothetical protein WAO08_24010 [Hyphomicrobiaceae bacterium]
MALKLKKQVEARPFRLLSEAEIHIGNLKMRPESLGRKFSVMVHPVDPSVFAIGILAGGALLTGYVS